MTNGIMIIRKMAESDIPYVAQLHKATLPGLPSDIGITYLIPFYTTFLSNPHHTCLLAVSKRKIVGVVIASYDHNESRIVLGKLIFTSNIFPTILLRIISGKISIIDLWKRMIFEKRAKSYVTSHSAYIIDLFVDSAHQRKGIGTTLITHILKDLKGKKIKDVFLDTRKNNIHAHTFYKSIGFTKLLSASDATLFTYSIQ